jgi:hypothetical protein
LIAHILLTLTLLPASLGQQSAPSAAKKADAAQLEITLERKRDGKIETMAPGHVFQNGDQFRLRLGSHYEGFLYVMDQGTSGRFATVFPAVDTGNDNRLHPDATYLIPGDTWFEVTGPAGFDVLYFLLSPAPIAQPTASSFVAPGPISSLRPRCNDKVFRARGECMDDTAGPAPIPVGQALPAPIAPLAGGASRDIVVSRKENGAVGVGGPASAPLLYTFRLAHQEQQ